MRAALTVLTIVVTALLAPVTWAQDIQVTEAEPAWCGGSWQPMSVHEVTDDKGTVTLLPVAGTGGTNFGPCLPLARAVKRMV